MEMTESFVFWKYLHLMMFVGWVGADMGVFLSCKKACDSTLSFDARMTLLHVALRIELIPRTMWKAALPLGVMLSREMGLLDITNTELALVWAFSIVWWAISMTGAIYYDKPWGQKVAHFANWIIGAVGIGLIAIAITSAMGQGPFDVSGTWLIWKVGLYGLIDGRRIHAARHGGFDTGNRGAGQANFQYFGLSNLEYLLFGCSCGIYRNHQVYLVALP